MNLYGLNNNTGSLESFIQFADMVNYKYEQYQ